MRALPSLLLIGCTASPDLDGPWLDVDEQHAQQLQAALEAARSEQGLPGLAMAVAYHDDHTLWVSASGSALLEPQTDWRPSHRSRIGSVTKTFTASRVHQLVEEGVIGLDDPIEQWVPGWYSGVTVEHLLGHSSGIASYNYIGSFDIQQAYTPQELVQWAWDREPALRFEPGTRWEYSNTNYVLLGLVIEAATGSSYEDNLEEVFFGPLGLSSMELAVTGDGIPEDLVHCYSAAPHTDSSALDPSFGWAAGSIVSTPEDLAIFTDALYFGDLLGPDALSRMVTPQGLTGEDDSEYGLGAFYESDGELTITGHTGGMAGYLSFAYSLNEPKATLVILSNQEDTDLRAASIHGWAAILDVAL